MAIAGKRTLADTSAATAALNYLRYQVLQTADYAPLTHAEHYYRYKHRDEISRTAEVADVLYADSIAAAFLRYSVGAKVFRDTQWLRRIDAMWMPTQDYFYYSEFGETDPFHDGNGERAKRIIDRVSKWSMDSASMF